jgi:hypothetical protein
MARVNYSFQKNQREQAKKKKQEEKRKRKEERKRLEGQAGSGETETPIEGGGPTA